MGFRVGPIKPAPAQSQMSLRDGMNVRLRGGIGPLRTALAHWSPYTPMTFAVTPPGLRAWVLTHPRNLLTRSTMDCICASRGNSNPSDPMN